MSRQIIVEYGQSLIDMCVQELGTADALFVVCGLNDLEYDADLHAGQVLTLPDLDPDNDIQQYFKDNAIQVNSHLTVDDEDILGTNDDEFITDGNGFGIGI